MNILNIGNNEKDSACDLNISFLFRFYYLIFLINSGFIFLYIYIIFILYFIFVKRLFPI